MLNKLMEESLFNMIETTVFDKVDLQDIKESLSLFKLPKDQKKDLIKSFLIYLNRIYEELTEKLPFFFEHLIIQQKILDYGEKGVEKSDLLENLREDIEKREELLTIVGEKLQHIFNNLE